MQNSIVAFTLLVLDWKYLFWANLAQKIKIVKFKLKFSTLTNSNVQNSMVVFTFSVFDGKDLFGANFVQKIKIVSFS